MKRSAPIHVLSKLDPDTRTANCAYCGPVTIQKKGIVNGTQRWQCTKANTRKQYARRNSYRYAKGPVCERCGFVPEDPAQLDVHHRDGDHKNNHRDNLITLCANCHRLVHAYERRGDQLALVPST